MVNYVCARVCVRHPSKNLIFKLIAKKRKRKEKASNLYIFEQKENLRLVWCHFTSESLYTSALNC